MGQTGDIPGWNVPGQHVRPQAPAQGCKVVIAAQEYGTRQGFAVHGGVIPGHEGYAPGRHIHKRPRGRPGQGYTHAAIAGGAHHIWPEHVEAVHARAPVTITPINRSNGLLGPSTPLAPGDISSVKDYPMVQPIQQISAADEGVVVHSIAPLIGDVMGRVEVHAGPYHERGRVRSVPESKREKVCRREER